MLCILMQYDDTRKEQIDKAEINHQPNPNLKPKCSLFFSFEVVFRVEYC